MSAEILVNCKLLSYLIPTWCVLRLKVILSVTWQPSNLSHIENTQSVIFHFLNLLLLYDYSQKLQVYYFCVGYNPEIQKKVIIVYYVLLSYTTIEPLGTLRHWELSLKYQVIKIVLYLMSIEIKRLDYCDMTTFVTDRTLQYIIYWIVK